MSTKLPQPEIQVIKLHKNANGMGLSIVAAKGSGQVINTQINLSINEINKCLFVRIDVFFS